MIEIPEEETLNVICLAALAGINQYLVRILWTSLAVFVEKS